MKKNFLLYSILFTSISSYGQVGIGTSTPKEILHIDPKKDTNLGSSSPTGYTDDVYINSVGNVGIGTISPSAKLEINSTTAGAIQIIDGTQGNKKVLVSDKDGVGTWRDLPVFQYMKNGTFVANQTINSDQSGGYKYSQGSITLKPGKWLISVGLTIRLRNDDAAANTKPYWLKLFLSSSQTALTHTYFTYTSPVVDNNFGGNMIKSQDTQYYNFITGSTIIEVTKEEPIYLLIENIYSLKNGTTGNYVFETRNYENYLYAIPTN